MIHLYVEHLLNIQTLSIHASLSTVSNTETKATISADGDFVTLTHEGETASVRLPINISPRRKSTAALTLPAVPSKELSFRVQLEQQNGHGNQADGNVVPWTAEFLAPGTEISCKDCSTTLLARGKITTWKNMPSEGWAEMMEFWHCHKPHEPHDHLNDLKKGYAAGSKLAMKAGVCMVDPLDFLLLSEDCSNIEPRNEPPGQESNLCCCHCLTTIGHQDPVSGAYRLNKLNLSVSTFSTQPAVSFEEQKWLSCLLLCAMDSKGVRKFVACYSPHNDRVLKLWVFTPDLKISSSALATSEPVRVVKVLWQEAVDTEAGSNRLTTASLAEEELHLQEHDVLLLQKLLEKSAALLPTGARKFQEWNIGLLERFTALDLTPRMFINARQDNTVK